jgi:ABC-type transporter Mla MlaB component
MMLLHGRHSPSGTVLCASEPLRVPVNTRLQHEVAAVLRRGDRRIRLSLAGIAEIDAGGIGELVRVYNMAAAANSVLRVVHVGQRVRELLVIVGLFELMSGDTERDVKIA